MLRLYLLRALLTRKRTSVRNAPHREEISSMKRPLEGTLIGLLSVAGRLTWLVYIIGAVIGGRVSFASTDEQDAMDGELVCR